MSHSRTCRESGFLFNSITGYVPGEWERVLAEHAYLARTKRDAQQRLLARAEAEEALTRWGLILQPQI